jgi:hypothetical protein
MSIVESVEPRIQNIKVTADAIVAYLVDGRVVSVPLAWSWRLSEATAKQRARFKLIGGGQGVHWPEIDEDISVEGMLHGVPAHHPQNSARLSRPQANGRHVRANKRPRRFTAKR